ERFPALRLAKECLAEGQTATAIMNAANEVAVGAFLNGKIGFLDIVRTVEKVVEAAVLHPVATIEDVIAADRQAREDACRFIEERTK
ncbi:MAG: 1-deoxy-D-xylulose-5-phosphate reductoisomerase, partial [Alphaproteobacteria bacterium]|nr:1-deoxy-D-xylulose-5-phosphate reductoisomerase [Alphaproteobacteria bacterium]